MSNEQKSSVEQPNEVLSGAPLVGGSAASEVVRGLESADKARSDSRRTRADSTVEAYAKADAYAKVKQTK